MVKIDNIEDIKNLIIWAREQNLASFTIGDLAVSFYPNQPVATDFMSKELRLDELQESDEEDILFHSSGGQ